jgi:hypothetical protein
MEAVALLVSANDLQGEICTDALLGLLEDFGEDGLQLYTSHQELYLRRIFAFHCRIDDDKATALRIRSIF